MPFLASRLAANMSGSVNWTIVPWPTAGWASRAFGEPDVDRLWGYLRFFLRLDQPDPIAAWNEHVERLSSRAAQMNERAFDALHYRGPGTDLTVGLMPDAKWSAAEMNTNWGVTFRPNLPTEEIFTAPDRRRADGVVRSTRPLATGGTVVRDLEVVFSGGVVTDVKASTGADIVRGQLEADEGARHTWASSRSSMERHPSASRASSSSTPCWTRTRPVTSHTALGSRRPWMMRPISLPRSALNVGSITARSIRTSWSVRPSSRSTGSRGTATASLFCERRYGSSTAKGLLAESPRMPDMHARPGRRPSPHLRRTRPV